MMLRFSGCNFPEWWHESLWWCEIDSLLYSVSGAWCTNERTNEHHLFPKFHPVLYVNVDLSTFHLCNCARAVFLCICWVFCACIFHVAMMLLLCSRAIWGPKVALQICDAILFTITWMNNIVHFLMLLFARWACPQSSQLQVASSIFTMTIYPGMTALVG